MRDGMRPSDAKQDGNGEKSPRPSFSPFAHDFHRCIYYIVHDIGLLQLYDSVHTEDPGNRVPICHLRQSIIHFCPSFKRHRTFSLPPGRSIESVGHHGRTHAENSKMDIAQEWWWHGFFFLGDSATRTETARWRRHDLTLLLGPPPAAPISFLSSTSSSHISRRD